jgi:hypothetical protein
MNSPATTLVAARALAAQRAQRQLASPLDLAKMCFPNYVVTPSLALISDVLVDAVENPDRRVIISTPPRSGKSVLVSQVLPVWALARDPNAEIILKAYGDELAEEHSREARRLIAEHSDTLGIGLSTGKASVGRWRLEGRRGGMLAGGILTGTTGFGANLLVVDDPIKSAVEADSAAYRRRLITEFRSSLLTRLHPGASTVIVLTRWNESDLAGELLAEGGWKLVNIPAIAEVGIPDALHRQTGVAMTSALGRTGAEYAEIRKAVGERAWWALYEGVPASPEGGLIKREWLDTWRLAVAPPAPLKVVVGVDPSDSGTGDSCGIVAASLSRYGTVALIADISEPLTAEQWARRAVELAIETGASEISVESFSAGTTYLAVVKDAIRRMRPERTISVTGWPPKGSGRGRGDAEARSAGLRQALEVGTCRIAGHLPAFEDQAVIWQSGQHQPDSVAAATVAFDVLDHARGAQVTFTNPAALGSFRDRRPGRDGQRRFEGPRSMKPVDSRITRRVSGGGYDPLAAPRRTIRGL